MSSNVAPIDFAALATAPRLLIEADLQPLQGERFQPTGFPDLGAATYELPNADKTPMVLLESPQSVANRLEMTIWDEDAEDVIAPLQGISYVRVERDGAVLTNSLLEAHRLNSFYLLEGEDKAFLERLQEELHALGDIGAVDYRQLAKVLAKYDVNSLLHGVFLAKKELSGGRFRLARALSGFIEAYNVQPVMYGGVKLDRVDPKEDAKAGGGNIPYGRMDYTAEKITAYFNLDLRQLQHYQLGEELTQLLIAIALWKIRRFLDEGLRLRTACDLDCRAVTVTRPAGFELPSCAALAQVLPDLVRAAQAHFAPPEARLVQYRPKVKQPKGSAKK
jgi:CRISPR-associated protein Csb1